MATIGQDNDTYDRLAELKAFDETKAGVKGLVDSGITHVPRIFHIPPNFPDHLMPSRSSATRSDGRDDPNFVFPVIDLEGILHDDKKRKEAVEKVKGASEKWGFFQVLNHGVPLDLLQEMEDGVRRFHETEDVELKKAFFRSGDLSDKVLYNSNYDLYTAAFATWRDTLYCQMAPDPPSPRQLPVCIREIVMEYTRQMLKLGDSLFQLLSEALGLPSNYLKEIDCVKGLNVACHYYPVCPQPELTLGGAKHRDDSFLTVLQQDRIGGFQVVHQDYWVDVPPVSGSLLVNIGDLLQLISNDKFISAEHRVLAHNNNKGGARISVANFFTTVFSPNPRLYGPIKELLSEDNPPKYGETTIEEHTTRGLNKNSGDIPVLDGLLLQK